MKDPIIRENGKIKTKIMFSRYETEFYTCRNGYQWVGQAITPEIARMSIEVLQEYLDGINQEE